MAVDVAFVRTAVLDARSKMWEKLEPHWQKLQQMNRGQKGIAALITILLISNIILLANLSTGQSDVKVSEKSINPH